MNERDGRIPDEMDKINEMNPGEMDERNERNEERDEMNERDEMEERQSLGFFPNADPWVDNSKPGGPTGSSPAPSPLPSNLNDPIPHWTSSDQISPPQQSSTGEKEQRIFYSGVYNFLFPIAVAS